MEKPSRGRGARTGNLREEEPTHHSGSSTHQSPFAAQGGIMSKRITRRARRSIRGLIDDVISPIVEHLEPRLLFDNSNVVLGSYWANGCNRVHIAMRHKKDPCDCG